MKYLFTETQFQIFMAVAEMDKIICFSFKEEPGERELVYELSKMIRQGRLAVDQGSVQIAPEMKWIADGMKLSGRVLRFFYGRHDQSEKLVYTGDWRRLVILEKEELETGDMVKVWCAHYDDLIQELIEEESLTDTVLATRDDALTLESVALSEKKVKDSADAAILRIERLRSSDGERLRIITIYEDLLYRWIDIEENGKMLLHHIYSKEELFDLLVEEFRS